jgi:hypothetical protein
MQVHSMAKKLLTLKYSLVLTGMFKFELASQFVEADDSGRAV